MAGPKVGGLRITHLPTADDALRMALADARRLPPEVQPYTRYIWIEDGETSSLRAVSFTANATSQGVTIVRPEPIGDGKRLLLGRVDLRDYVRRVDLVGKLATIWEEFQFDPALNILITKGTLLSALAQFGDYDGLGSYLRWERTSKELGAPWHMARHLGPFKLRELKDVELIRIPDPGMDPAALAELCALTGSQAPIVTHPYYVFRALSTIKDDGLYAILFGGLYYDLSGISGPFKKGSDLDNLLDALGVGSVKEGVTADQVFERLLRSDMRSAVFRSKVRAHAPRRVDLFPILQGRLDQAIRICSITHDLKRKRIDLDTHPLGDLLNIKDDAREVIFDLANGLHGYAAADGKGKLQEKVPDDVAVDHTIPDPYLTELQGAIGCISCHEAKPGFDGWQPLTNDVNKLVRPGGLDIFGNFSRGRAYDDDTVARLRGLYQGNPERPLQQGRDAYAAAVLRATGPWAASKRGQADVVELTAKKVVGIWRDYWYDGVDAAGALREIGIRLDFPGPAVATEATKLFSALTELAHPPIPLALGPVIPEDPRIAAIRVGIITHRSDWALARGFAGFRVRQNLPRVLK